jgi:DUF2971 family protein
MSQQNSSGQRNFPPMLYRYQVLNDNTRRIFTHCELFCASPSTFNDPLDCHLLPSLEGTKNSWWDWHMKVNNTHYPHIRGKIARRIFNEMWKKGGNSPDEYIRMTERTILNSMKALGVLCLTENRCNTVMFSHYSNNHSGFCIGLRLEPMSPFYFQIRPDGDIRRLILRVDYLHEIDQRPNFFTDDQYPHWIIKTKHADWSYEREWRILNRDGAEAIHFPKDMLREVILGCNISVADGKELRELIRSNGLQPRVYQAKTTHSKLSLELLDDSIGPG